MHVKDLHLSRSILVRVSKRRRYRNEINSNRVKDSNRPQEWGVGEKAHRGDGRRRRKKTAALFGEQRCPLHEISRTHGVPVNCGFSDRDNWVGNDAVQLCQDRGPAEPSAQDVTGELNRSTGFSFLMLVSTAR